MSLWGRVISVFGLVCAAASLHAHPSILLTATLDGAQVAEPFGSAGSPAQSTNGGTVSLLYNPNATEGGLFLSYTIQLNGLDLDGTETPNDPSDDVLGIQFRMGGKGTNGPHVLNVFGQVEGVIRRDDAQLSVHATNSYLQGAWNDMDENLTGSRGTRRDVDSIKLSDALDDLLADRLYVHVATRAFPEGELRGQILSRPPLIVPQRLSGGSLQLTIDHKTLREYRIESSTNLTNWNLLTNLYSLQSVARFVDFGAATQSQRFYRISELVILPLHISIQPQSTTINAGQPLNLSVVASGSEPVTYQWFRNEVPIAGATNVNYSVAATTADDAGIYKIEIVNPGGQLDSQNAVVTVNP